MPSDGDWLLEAILAEPCERLHRLAYADWLEENQIGHPARWRMIRGEKVKAPWQDVFPGFADCRMDAIVVDGDLVSRLRKDDSEALLEFKDGFLHRTWTTPENWLRHGPSWMAENPLEEGRCVLFKRTGSVFLRLTMPYDDANTFYSVRAHVTTVPFLGIWERVKADPNGTLSEGGRIMYFVSRERAAEALRWACMGWAAPHAWRRRRERLGLPPE